MTNQQLSNDERMTDLPRSKWKLSFVISFVILILSFVILPSVAFADLEILGYYENNLVGAVTRTGEAIAGDLNRMRLRIDARLMPNVNLHLEPEYNLLLKTADIPVSGVSGLDQLVWDRTYLKMYFPQADLTVGKQRIAWGAGYLWNPTDVFNPFTLSFAVEEEQEAEPEAVRLEIPLGEASGIDTYVVSGHKWHETKKGIRARTNLELFDLSLSAVDLGSGGFQLGFDTTGELFGLGVRNETAFISPAGENRYLQSVFGWNYTFENGWGVDMEYFFNGQGKRNKDDYNWDALEDGDIFQLGMDYFYFGVNKLVDEITGIRGSVLLNADDLSFILYPSYTRNIFQNVDLSLEALLSIGEKGTEYNPTDTQDPDGFMGSSIIFIKLRYNFSLLSSSFI
ncbi:hypothetical protein AMJ44_03585 [candidate division WOR-1 bacterium DG_54_3]|uniref:Uncharacterized protein n=1 Tax=candidate division WOR-1 bacterium DG_54_3 TaxID=1703775 RepID=A0A0S7Y467_UNCSA|nr:MAG: hypothetical protein AMJ44_03585 [candidate division WOR-1 bacterium DG_54_3]